MWKSLVIPNDLAACQSLLAELAKGFAAEPGAVENHLLTIKSHELTIKTHELTITSLNDRLEKLQQENAEQKLTISELLRRAFEKRSERYLEHPDQLRLDFGNTPEAADAAESLAEALEQAASAATEIVVPEHTRRQHLPRKPRNEQLPAHLPRHVVDAPSPRRRVICCRRRFRPLATTIRSRNGSRKSSPPPAWRTSPA